MGTNAYANGRSIACKAASGKSVCCFPDVCLSPPSPPSGPIPIPYPNTGMARDIKGGSKSVKVAGKPTALKNASCFSKSTGDEAATKSLGMGVVTHQIRGKVYFNSWSMDVKIEGKNAPRMMDLTTHNHRSLPGNTPTWPYIDQSSPSWTKDPDCKGDIEKEQKACEGCTPYGDKDPCGDPPPEMSDRLKELNRIPKPKRTAAQKTEQTKLRKAFAAEQKKYCVDAKEANSKNDCLKARRCQLVPYVPQDKQRGCCPGQTGHHLVEAATFIVPGTRDTPKKDGGPKLKNPEWKYDLDRAPCVCAEGFNNTTASHGLMHTYQGVRANKLAPKPARKWTMSQAADTGAGAVRLVFPESDCSHACLQKQIEAYHEKAGIKPTDTVDAVPSGRTDDATAKAAWEQYSDRKPAYEARAKPKPKR